MIVIIIAIGLILLNSNEQTVEEKWLEERITSGPFSIDKGEYNLGEKIFISVDDLKEEDKGKVIFFRPLNNTSWSNYITMDFDGTNDFINISDPTELTDDFTIAAWIYPTRVDNSYEMIYTQGDGTVPAGRPDG